MRPVLRYHGSKFRLAPWIISHFPEHRCYVEPFSGGGSVLMQKPRSESEVLNDLDGRVCNVFRVLRDPAQAEMLRDALELTPYSRSEFELSRQVSDDPVEDARRMITLAFQGFSTDACTRPCATGFRASHYRERTTPARDWARYPAVLWQFTARLKGVVVEQQDAFELIPRLDRPGVLFYCDPPYLHSTRVAVASHQRCYRHEMTDEDHIRLSELLHAIEGMALISGYESDLYRDLYTDWQMACRDTQASNSSKRTECLWIKPNTRVAQGRLL